MKTITIQETAYFYHHAENCNYEAQLTIALCYNSIIISIIDNTTARPNTKIKVYKSKKKTYEKYLYRLGKSLRGYWKFDKFVYNKELIIKKTMLSLQKI